MYYWGHLCAALYCGCWRALGFWAKCHPLPRWSNCSLVSPHCDRENCWEICAVKREIFCNKDKIFCGQLGSFRSLLNFCVCGRPWMNLINFIHLYLDIWLNIYLNIFVTYIWYISANLHTLALSASDRLHLPFSMQRVLALHNPADWNPSRSWWADSRPHFPNVCHRFPEFPLSMRICPVFFGRLESTQ